MLLRSFVTPLAIAALVSGCLGIARPGAAPGEFDFGPLPRMEGQQRNGVRVRVAAPSWLSTTAMHYRQLHVDPAQRRQYADSQWVAPPAELLSLHLEHRLASVAASLRCELVVDLIELEQVFERAESSQLRLAVRVTLSQSGGDKSALRTEADFLEEARPADVRGGVAAAGRAVERLGGRLEEWLKLPAATALCQLPTNQKKKAK